MADRATPKAFVDASVLVRFLTGDDPDKGNRVRALLERADAGEIELHGSHVLIAELVWTLRSVYGRQRAPLAEIVRDLVDSRGIRIPDRAMLLDAIDTFGRRNADFVDAHHVAEMRSRELRSIYSYDRDFDKLGVRRLEP